VAVGLYLVVRTLATQRGYSFRQKVFVAGALFLLAAAAVEILHHTGFIPLPAEPIVSELALVVYLSLLTTASVDNAAHELQAAVAAERRAAEDRAATERLDALRTSLVRQLSHEIHTPLAVMVGFAQVVAADIRDGQAGPETASDLDIVANEGQRLSTLVDELGTISRSWAATPEVFPLARVVGHVARMFAPIFDTRGIDLHVDVPASLPEVRAVPGQVIQVLVNLLSNADKHTRDGHVTLRATVKGRWVEVSVTDTGTGVAPELLARVFEPGVHADAGGSGIGLALSRELIEAAGGVMTIDSPPDQGATVTFTVPIA
jgi:signal transduction histidine kinase